MSLLAKVTSQDKALRLLSFSSGGARGLSQLKILEKVMNRYSLGISEKNRPCDIFDMVGGTGSGGFIAILLVVLGLQPDIALEEFYDLSVNVLGMQGVAHGDKTRIVALQRYIEDLLKRYHIKGEQPLSDPVDRPRTCKLVVPISYQKKGRRCILRNFKASSGDACDLTLRQALLATMMTPPIFPSNTLQEFPGIKCMASYLPLSGLVREMVSEACRVFNPEAPLACFLVIESGDVGVISITGDIWSNSDLERVFMATDQEEQDMIEVLASSLGIYHRFSVVHGLGMVTIRSVPDPSMIAAHTEAYLCNALVSKKLNLCVDSMLKERGTATLEQLDRAINNYNTHLEALRDDPRHEKLFGMTERKNIQDQTFDEATVGPLPPFTETDQGMHLSPPNSTVVENISTEEDMVDNRCNITILPFLQVPFLLAERALQLSRRTKAFHVQGVHIARQALRLVLLLNLAVDATGPTDGQLEAKDTLQEQLIQLHGAMKKWATNIEPQDKAEEEIESQYNRFFGPRFYFPAARGGSTREVLVKLRAYDSEAHALEGSYH